MVSSLHSALLLLQSATTTVRPPDRAKVMGNSETELAALPVAAVAAVAGCVGGGGGHVTDVISQSVMAESSFKTGEQRGER